MHDAASRLEQNGAVRRLPRLQGRYAAFHLRSVLILEKVFVANPTKSLAVQRLLIMNREKLLKFLPNFLEERSEDEQFLDEKSFIIREIEMLPPKPIEHSQQQVV